jgi:transglutaminase-like putative cysteine protease
MSRTPPLLLDRRGELYCAALVAAALLPHLARLHPAVLIVLATLFVGRLVFVWRGAVPVSAWQRLLLVGAVLGLIVLVHGGGAPREGGIALLASMLVLKLYETHKVRDARSLAAFALFAPLGALLLDTSLTATLYALAVTVFVFLALRDIADLAPGRQRSLPQSFPLGLGSLLGSALAALPLTAVLFVLFPRLPAPLWGAAPLESGRTGLGDAMSPGDLRELLIDDRTAVRIEIRAGSMPEEQDRYLRGPVLWDFDGRRWSRGAPPLRLRPPETAPAASPRILYELSLEPSDRPWVPALDAPLAAPAGLVLDRDRVLRHREPITRPQSFSLESARTGGGLLGPPSPSERSRALALPEGFDPRSRELARRWMGEARGDPRQYIERILAWFAADFRYDLAPPPLGRHSVDDFLFSTRTGYCEHFASSFAVLMRAGGIPARVVTGFHGGYRNPLGDYWIFRYSDAHAWVEVLLGDAWIRVDPTAAVAPERRELGALGGGIEGDGGFGLRRSLAMLGDWITLRWHRLVLDFDHLRQQHLLRPFGIEETTWRELGLLIALALLLSAAVGIVLVLRGRAGQRPDAALRAWALLERKLARLGLSRRPSEGPLDWITRTTAALPSARAELGRFAERFVAARYAGFGPEVGRELLEAVRRWRPPPFARLSPAASRGDAPRADAGAGGTRSGHRPRGS